MCRRAGECVCGWGVEGCEKHKSRDTTLVSWAVSEAALRRYSRHHRTTVSSSVNFAWSTSPSPVSAITAVGTLPFGVRTVHTESIVRTVSDGSLCVYWMDSPVHFLLSYSSATLDHLALAPAFFFEYNSGRGQSVLPPFLRRLGGLGF